MLSFRSEWELALVQCNDRSVWAAEEPLEEILTAYSVQGRVAFCVVRYWP